MKAVIVAAERQSKEVSNLVSYIKDLDGTEVVIIPAIDETDEYPARNNYAFHQAAQIMAGEPFFWLEPDSIPLKAGWLKTIEKEYSLCCKQFMLSCDQNPPHDLIGGIGVYGPRTHEIIPKRIDGDMHGHGWDLWMFRKIPNMIHWSPLIQHSYGVYDKWGNAKSHEFPRDNSIIRKESVIFHRDKYQDIINYKLLCAKNHPKQ
jgi:hypothetical protein